MGSGEEPAVDEKGGGAGHADLSAFFRVLEHVGLELTRGGALLEGLDVERELGGVLTQILVGQRPLVGKELVVVFPELALVVGALGSLGRRLCAIVITEREVAKDEADLVAVGFANLL